MFITFDLIVLFLGYLISGNSKKKKSFCTRILIVALLLIKPKNWKHPKWPLVGQCLCKLYHINTFSVFYSLLKWNIAVSACETVYNKMLGKKVGGAKNCEGMLIISTVGRYVNES